MRFFALLLVCACQTAPRARAPEGPPAPAAGSYSCFTMRSGDTTGSFCYPDAGRCESERGAAASDGAQTNVCYRQSPVACFQLRGDPRPDLEMCAASQNDCDLLRRIDRDKNGTSAAACEWRHQQ